MSTRWAGREAPAPRRRDGERGAAAAPVDTRELLTRGAIAVKGRMPASSNVTLLAEISLAGATGLAIYKPERGERPLWDFPRGLHRRELAAYELSETLGWGLVPLTVCREGPYGDGSFQHFVDADFAQHYFTLVANPAHHDRLRRICLFDLLANNADRKSGHCLLGEDGQIYAIDNGLCFHVDPKLRTVIWDFAGDSIPGRLLDDLRALLDRGLPAALTALLAPEEIQAMRGRAQALIARRRFPADRSGYRYPWPPV
jgi:uncharacterized repeat protein (TIGR03843 family)